MNSPRRQLEPSAAAFAGRLPWLALVALAGAVGVVYGRSLDATIIFDDDVSVLTHNSIHSLWPLVGAGDDRGVRENPGIEARFRRSPR